MTVQEVKFLEESNAIEGVFDKDSLTQACYAWDYVIHQRRLTVNVILNTHKILMVHQRILPHEKGFFRDEQVMIGNRLGYQVHRIKPSIIQWCETVEETIKKPGKDGCNIKRDHIEYEMIHPFIDGNGRTGRMFMNWERIKAGLPLLTIYNSQKTRYYQWFK